MKNDLRLLRNLAAVFAAMLAVTGLALWLTRAPAETEETEEALWALDYSVSQIGGITVANGQSTFSLLSGQDGIELLSGDETQVSADKTNLQAYYYNICHLPALQQLADGGQVSFDAPAARLVLLSFAGDRYSYTLSDARGPGGEYYLRDDDAGAVWVLEESAGQLLLTSAQEFVSHQLAPAIDQNNLGDIEEISVESALSPDSSFSLLQTSSGNVTGYRMTSPVNLRLDWETVLDQLMVPLSQLYPDAIASTRGDLENYGLDAPAWRIQVTAAGQTSTVLVGEKDGAYYLTDGEAQVIGRLDQDQVAFLGQSYERLLDHQLYPVNRRSIAEIEATADGETRTLTFAWEGDVLTVSAGGQSLSSADAPELATVFVDVPLASSARAEDAVEDAPRLELTYTLADGSRDVLRFWRTQSGEYAVEYNGEVHFTTLASVVDGLCNTLARFAG